MSSNNGGMNTSSSGGDGTPQEDAKTTRRRAIQAIMMDKSLSHDEKNSRVQNLIRGSINSETDTTRPRQTQGSGAAHPQPTVGSATSGLRRGLGRGLARPRGNNIEAQMGAAASATGWKGSTSLEPTPTRGQASPREPPIQIPPLPTASTPLSVPSPARGLGHGLRSGLEHPRENSVKSRIGTDTNTSPTASAPPPVQAPAPVPAEVGRVETPHEKQVSDDPESARRQAIQVIMRNNTLTNQEKHSQVQNLMRGNNIAVHMMTTPQQPEQAEVETEDEELATPQETTSAEVHTMEPLQDPPVRDDPESVRRQEIQAIMRDSTLSNQEKHAQVQNLMRGKNLNTETSSSPEPAQSASASVKDEAVETSQEPLHSDPETARRQAIQTIMRDTTLSNQEKHAQVQNLMRGNNPITQTRSFPEPAQAESAPVESEGAETAQEPIHSDPETVRRQAIQAIMRNNTLSNQEKHAQVQNLMRGNIANVQTRETHQDVENIEKTEQSIVGSERRRAIQAIMRNNALSNQEKHTQVQSLLRKNNNVAFAKASVAAAAENNVSPVRSISDSSNVSSRAQTNPSAFSSKPGAVISSTENSTRSGATEATALPSAASVVEPFVKPVGASFGRTVGGAPSGKMRSRTAPVTRPGAVNTVEPSMEGSAEPAVVQPAAAPSNGTVGGAPVGKTRRTIVSMTPGATNIVESAQNRIAEQTVSPSSAGTVGGAPAGKVRRTIASMTPGATSVVEPTVEPGHIEPPLRDVGTGTIGGAPVGKIRRTTAALRPGAIDVAEQSAGAAAAGSINVAGPPVRNMQTSNSSIAGVQSVGRDDLVKQGMRGLTLADKPGAESVSGSGPIGVSVRTMNAAVQSAEQDARAKQGLRRSAATKPGIEAVSSRTMNAAVQSAEQDIQTKLGLRRSVATTPGIEAVSSRTMNAAVQSAEQDVQTKLGLRRSAATTPGVEGVSSRTMNGAVLSAEQDAQAKLGLRRSVATTPGIEAVSSRTMNAAVLSAEQDARAKLGLRRSAATTPGVEGVSSGTMNAAVQSAELDAQVKQGLRRPAATSPGTGVSSRTMNAAVQSAEQDAQAKLGLRRPAATTPGVQGVSSRTMNAAVQSVELDAQVKQGLRRSAATTPKIGVSSRTMNAAVQSAEQDAQAKLGLRRPAATIPGVQGVSSRTMNAAVQSFEQDAQAKRGLRRPAATIPGVQGVSSRTMNAAVESFEQDALAKRGLQRLVAPEDHYVPTMEKGDRIDSSDKEAFLRDPTQSGKRFPEKEKEKIDVGEVAALSESELYQKRMEDKILKMENDLAKNDELEKAKEEKRNSEIFFPEPTKKDTHDLALSPQSSDDKEGEQVYLPTDFKELDHTEAIEKAKEEGLAIARAVEEDEEEEFIFGADAKQYDPNAKPPIYKNRRFQCYASLFAVLAIGVIIGALIPSFTNEIEDIYITQAPSAAPSQSPTTSRESEFRRTFIEAVGPFEPDSPHDRAAIWIMEEDPMGLELDAENLIQRYTLALFWFKTTNNGNDEWVSCNPPREGENSTCVYQEYIRQPDNSLVYFDVPGETRWLSEEHECEWVGVWCEHEFFIGIDLQGQDMTGTLPPELANLQFFAFGIFSFNLFTGNIPWEWSQAPHLFMVEVMSNLLTGQIPGDFFRQNANLWELNPSNNQVDGTIPTEIGYLSGLQNLYLFDTDMGGSIPTEIGNVRDLSLVWMYNSQFNGSIPSEIGRCTRIVDFFLFRNRLTGTLPSELGNLQRMGFLKLDGNEIRGTIPEELYDLTALTRLDLYDLRLEGTISTRIGLLTNLFSFRFRDNRLNGTIPTEIGNMVGLISVWIHFNEFEGPVPRELCYIAGLSQRYGGQLNADCGPLEEPANECLCCSGCCDRESRECIRMGV